MPHDNHELRGIKDSGWSQQRRYTGFISLNCREINPINQSGGAPDCQVVSSYSLLRHSSRSNRHSIMSAFSSGLGNHYHARSARLSEYKKLRAITRYRKCVFLICDRRDELFCSSFARVIDIRLIGLSRSVSVSLNY